MDAYAFAVRDVLDERHEFLELGRPGVVDGVRTCGDEEVGILEGREVAGFAVEFKRQGTVYGFAVDGVTGQGYGFHMLRGFNVEIKFRRNGRSLIFLFIDVIDTHECSGEGGDFTEGYEQGFVDLALWVNIDTAEEENEATDGEDGGGDELYVEVMFHRLF